MWSKINIVLYISLMLLSRFGIAQQIFSSDNCTVKFESNAPLEIIIAESKDLRGIVNLEDYTFAFKMRISDFDGFNSGLQKIHFNESYLESEKYPDATFVGRFIDKPDIQIKDLQEVRVKGIMNIHGVEHERIIKLKLWIEKDIIKYRSFFSVLLAEYDIRIPRMVHQKIAEKIIVNTEGRLIRKPL